MGSKPKVSVLMPVYNAERYVGEAIESILAQTFEDFEFIIVDDASTDGTPAVLDTFDDHRIARLRNDRNLGIPSTRNRCVAQATGEYVAWMDGDDLSAPTRLARQVDYLDKHPEIAALGTWAQIIAATGEPVATLAPVSDPAEIRVHLDRGNVIVGASVTARRGAILSVGGYRPLMGEDYDLWLRLADTGPCLASLPEFLYVYRVYPGSETNRNQALYSVVPLLLQAATLRRRRGKRDPLDGLDCEGFARLAKATLKGKGHCGRERQAERHWKRALGYHGAGRKARWVLQVLTVLRWSPTYGPLWACAKQAACRRFMRQ